VPTVADALDQLIALPGVADGVSAAREALSGLRWHQALRRRTAEVAAESQVRAARASAALAGPRYPLELVRDVARGAAQFPDDAAGLTALGAIRATAQIDRLGDAWQRSPAQALARLHVAAAAGVVPEEALGRPRRSGEPAGDGHDLLDPTGQEVPAPDGEELVARLAGLDQLLNAPPSSPALVVAAIAHAEIAVIRPFVTGNGVVARAICRAVIIGRGLDPLAVGVWEAALVRIGPAYPLALARYGRGGADGVAHWLTLFAQAVLDGAGDGRAVCDAVVAGRLPH
jgi:Fic family protein